MKGNRKPRELKPRDQMLVRRDYYISPEQDSWLKKMSEERNIPVAQIVRELIDQAMSQTNINITN
jgi:hypothetical protein